LLFPYVNTRTFKRSSHPVFNRSQVRICM